MLAIASVDTRGEVASRLAGIVARGAAPCERVPERGLSPVCGATGDVHPATARERAWLAGAGLPADGLPALLAALGTTHAAWRRSLHDVEVTDATRLPAWAREFRRLVSALGRHSGHAGRTSCGSSNRSVSVAMAGGDPWSRLLLERAALLVRGADVFDPVVVPALAADVTARLAPLLVTLRGDDAPDTVNAWLHRFEAFPVAARLVSLTVHQWQEHLLQLRERLLADSAHLAATFGGGARTGRVIGYRGGLSDPHDGGRMVCRLDFESGPSLAWKPHDMSGAAAFGALLGCAARDGVVPAPQMPRTLAGTAHGWQEWIEPSPCPDPAAVARYFGRVGVLSRLLQLFDATDCIAENVIAWGEHPMLIDLEGLLSARTRLAEDTPAGDRLLAEQVWDTPLRVGLITAQVVGAPGRRAADLGAMATADRRRAPFGSADDTFPDATALPSGPGGAWSGIAPGDHLPALVDGYVAAAAWARGAGAGAIDELLAVTASAPARLIFRNTHLYARLRTASLAPSCLADAYAREASLARLWRAHFTSRAPAAVVRAELAALRDMDIPVFHVQAGDDALRDGRGTCVPGFGEGTAIGRVQARRQALQQSGPDTDADAVRLALFVRDPTQENPAQPERGHGVTVSAASGRARWRDAAAESGAKLLDAAYARGASPHLWTTLLYTPAVDAWNFGPLGADLFSGAAGVGVVLADLFAATGDTAFRDGAHAAAAAMGGFGTLAAHGTCGVAGVFHAALRMERALGVRLVVTDGCWAAMQAAPAPTSCDIATGSSGTALALQASVALVDAIRPEMASSLRMHASAAAQAHAGLSGRSGLRASHPDGAVSLATLPGLTVADRLVSSRCRGEPHVVPVVEGLSRTCGAGDALGLAVLAGGADGSSRSAAHVCASRAAVRALGTLHGGSPCAALDALVIQVAMRELTGARHWRDAAQDVAGAIVARGRAGAWLSPSIAPDHVLLSAIVGLAAVAHALLRLHDGASAPGLRVPAD
ncbi:MAG: type 2 lantipeptide synthetase LanM [Gemmatimonadaceae bacterium]|nr:type 2 lantipeptide synthetase LanM [Gemmatimonadaceae bacterium]